MGEVMHGMVASYGSMDWWALHAATHIQGLFKTRVLGARGNGGLKALQVMAENRILAHSINLGNTLRDNNNYLYNLSSYIGHFQEIILLNSLYILLPQSLDLFHFKHMDIAHLAGTHLYSWVKRGTQGLKQLA